MVEKTTDTIIELGKTDENSKVSFGYLYYLQILLQIVAIILVLATFCGIPWGFWQADNIRHMPGFMQRNELQIEFAKNILLGIASLAFLAILIGYRIVWTTFEYGDESRYEIGYAKILQETTNAITLKRFAIQLWPILTWGRYRVERVEGEAKMDDITTKDKSTVRVKIYFAYMPLLVPAAVRRGVRELNPTEIMHGWVGIINQYLPEVVHDSESETLVGNPSIIIEGFMKKIIGSLDIQDGESLAKKEGLLLLSGGGRIKNFAIASILRRMSAEVQRNPDEIKAARAKFEQERINEARNSNAENLKKNIEDLAPDFDGNKEKALDAILLTERREGEQAAKKIIIEGGDTKKARDASILNKW